MSALLVIAAFVVGLFAGAIWATARHHARNLGPWLERFRYALRACNSPHGDDDPAAWEQALGPRLNVIEGGRT